MATGSNLSQRSNTEAEITPQLIRGKSRRSERCGGESPKLGPVHIARRGTRCIIQSPLRFFIHFSPLVFPPLCPRSRGREWTVCLSVCTIFPAERYRPWYRPTPSTLLAHHVTSQIVLARSALAAFSPIIALEKYKFAKHRRTCSTETVMFAVKSRLTDRRESSPSE